jgi:glycosyltransferase involved in cell wall biosynthesis
MIEAMNLKVPVICTGYSGNMDFCSAETSWLVDYAEVPLDREDYIFVRKGQKWADPDVEHAARQLQAVRDDPHDRKRRVDAAYANVTRNFSAKAIAKRYGRRLQEIFEAIDRGASA